MRLRYLKLGLVALSLTTCSLFNIANAGVITDTSAGTFIDETTNLEWMDFGINNAMSYNQVASELGTGGLYEGWNLATASQVYSMWGNAFLGLGADVIADYNGIGQFKASDWSSTGRNVLEDVFNAMGYNYESNGFAADHLGYQYSFGFFQGDDGLSGVELESERTTSSIRIEAIIHDNYNYDSMALYSQYNLGASTLLVKQASVGVPAPPMGIIFALGLMGLVLRRFNKQA